MPAIASLNPFTIYIYNLPFISIHDNHCKKKRKLLLIYELWVLHGRRLHNSRLEAIPPQIQIRPPSASWKLWQHNPESVPLSTDP